MDVQKQVLITGGLGDIAGAIAVKLSDAGFGVTLLDRPSPEEAETRLRELRRRGVQATYVQGDVREPREVQRAVDGMPRLDVVVANAGIGRSAPVLDLTMDEWQAHLDVNLTGSFITGQVGARRMVADNRPGLLVFISSWIGSVPWPEMTAYIASKAGIEMLSKQFARELAPYGIRSNVVAPGIVLAGMAKRQLETEPQYAERTSKVVPLGRLQEPESVAGAVRFLCGADGEYMTGSKITVDGGASLFAFD